MLKIHKTYTFWIHSVKFCPFCHMPNITVIFLHIFYSARKYGLRGVVGFFQFESWTYFKCQEAFISSGNFSLNGTSQIQYILEPYVLKSIPCSFAGMSIQINTISNIQCLYMKRINRSLKEPGIHFSFELKKWSKQPLEVYWRNVNC